jgi:AraC family transcriptional regulator
MPGSATIAAVNAREARAVRPKAASAATPGNAFSHRPHASGGRLGWPLIRFERKDAQPGCRDMPHGAPEYLVLVSLGSGALTRQIGSECVGLELNPGFVTVVPKGLGIRWSWDTPISVCQLTLDPDFLCRVAEQTFGLDPSEVELVFSEREHDPVISTIASTLAREAITGDAGSGLYAESLAGILAVHLLRNYTANGAAPAAADSDSSLPRPVAKAIAFMQANHGRDIELKDIAAAAHLSPYYLARIFKRATGLAPHQYLIRVRVNNARSLLAAGAGRGSLAEIAAAVGFSDQSHLTRHFKRAFGVTPGVLSG